MFGASADSTEPAQKIATPMSITRLRPNSSPTMPKASMAPAKVSASALTTHCRKVTPACRSPCTLPSATLTIVLSRKVRNSTIISAASAAVWPGWRAASQAQAGAAIRPLLPASGGVVGMFAPTCSFAGRGPVLRRDHSDRRSALDHGVPPQP